MDKKYLNDEFDRFFEFTTEDKSRVSSVSAKLFAEHIAYPIFMNNAQMTTRIEHIEKEVAELRETDRVAKFCVEGFRSLVSKQAALIEKLGDLVRDREEQITTLKSAP